MEAAFNLVVQNVILPFEKLVSVIDVDPSWYLWVTPIHHADPKRVARYFMLHFDIRITLICMLFFL